VSARIRSQRGTALITALGALTVIGVLTASVAAVSVRVSDTSTSSRDAKRALAAADAGVEAAVFRLNRQNAQTAAKCLTDQLVDPVSGECPGYTEDLGNGTKYTYYVTPELSTTDKCAGLPVQLSQQNGVQTIVQRCVTSIGIANGQRRRVQARVASYQGAPIFPKPGILGLNSVTSVNNSAVVGYLGSNGKITLGNNTNASTLELGTNGTYQLGTGSQVGSIVQRTPAQGDFVLAPINFGNSATVNDNGRITSVPQKDATTGTVTYTNTAASPRSLTMATGSTLVLGGGTYNFCKLTAANNTKIKLAAGVKVRIYIDSPDRTGSGCIPSGMTRAQAQTAGWGGMTMGQGMEWENLGDPVATQIYVYGWNDGSQMIQFNNSAGLNLAIVAPQTKLFFGNSGVLNGGVAAKDVEFKNGASFTWGSSLASLRSETLALFYKTAWKECQRNATTATDPESGCNS
jgi:Tfp pilus assembly protein PilX